MTAWTFEIGYHWYLPEYPYHKRQIEHWHLARASIHTSLSTKYKI